MLKAAQARTTRRALFAAAPIVACAAVPALAMATPRHPDAELIELGRRHRIAYADEAAYADGALDEAQRRYTAMIGEKPVVIEESRHDGIIERAWDIGDIPKVIRQRNRSRRLMATNSWEAKEYPRWSQKLAALVWWAKRTKNARVQSGLDAAEAQYVVLSELAVGLEDAIFERRATTIEGLRVKAHAYRTRLGSLPDDEGAASLMRDLLGIA